MTPSQQAKQLGCQSLAQVARVSGVNPRTLLNYHKHKPWLFEAVCEKVALDSMSFELGKDGYLKEQGDE